MFILSPLKSEYYLLDENSRYFFLLKIKSSIFPMETVYSVKS